jgi:hypothetical protein
MTSEGRGILSPVRLPVPPLQRGEFAFSIASAFFAILVNEDPPAWRCSRHAAPPYTASMLI